MEYKVMRNISFMLTPDQVLDQTKDVTRRQGWLKLKPGDLLQPVRKGMGLKKGEKVEKLGPPIRVKSVIRMNINLIHEADCKREGFPDMTPYQFTEFYCKANKCKPTDLCTRIEFEYT